MDNARLFGQLKPICTHLAQLTSLSLPEPDYAEINRELKSLLSILEPLPDIDNQLAEYIFFPVFQLLQRDNIDDSLAENVLHLYYALLCSGWKSSMDPKRVKTAASIILYLVSTGAPSTFTKIAGCKSLSQLYTNYPLLLDPVQVMRTNVATLLIFLEDDSSSELQEEALRTLASVIELIRRNTKDPTKASKILQEMIPGTFSTVSKIASGRVGGRASATSLEIMMQILTSLVSAVFVAPDVTALDAAWTKATDQQMRMALSTFAAKLRDHQKLQVRQSLQLLFLTIANASNSLSACLPLAVENLIYLLSVDSSEEVQFELELLVQNPNFREVAANKIDDWISSLPRILSQHDDSRAISVVKALSVAVTLYPSQSLSERLLDNLQLAVKIHESRSIMTVQTTQFDPSKITAISPIPVALSISSASQNLIEHLVMRLGSSEYANILVENSLNDAAENDTSLWLLSTLLRGAANDSNSSSQWLIGIDPPVKSSNVLDAIQLFHEKLDSDESSRDSISISLRGMAEGAQLLKNDFRYELIEGLYPIIKHLGSSDPYILQQCQYSCQAIAQSCGYSSVREMIVDNADYLIDSVSVKLNSLDITPYTWRILSALITVAGDSIVAYLTDTISSLFVMLDNYHGYISMTQGIFEVFNSLVVVVRDKYLSNLQIDLGDWAERKQTHVDTFDDLLQWLKDKPEIVLDEETIDSNDNESHPNKPFQEGTSIDDSNNVDAEETEVTDPKPMKTPQELELEEWTSCVPNITFETIEKVITYLQYFLTHDSVNVRAGLLQLLIKCIPILSTSQKRFLPIVNDYWPLIVARLNDEETLVVELSLQSIALTCEHAKEFMSGRLVSLWPILKKTLLNRTAVKNSTENMSVENHLFSSTNRIFKAAARCITEMLVSVSLPAEQFDDMLSTCFAALRFYPELREAFCSVNADAVWLMEHT